MSCFPSFDVIFVASRKAEAVIVKSKKNFMSHNDKLTSIDWNRDFLLDLHDRRYPILSYNYRRDLRETMTFRCTKGISWLQRFLYAFVSFPSTEDQSCIFVSFSSGKDKSYVFYSSWKRRQSWTRTKMSTINKNCKKDSRRDFFCFVYIMNSIYIECKYVDWLKRNQSVGNFSNFELCKGSKIFLNIYDLK